MNSEFSRLSKRLFAVLDLDGTGKITWSEFVKFQSEAREVLLGQWQMDAKSLRREFDAFDSDGNGVISQEEFENMMEQLYSKGSPEGLKMLGDIVEIVIANHQPKSDTDSGWSGPKADFIRIMLKNFEKADANCDGVVTFSEFLRHEFAENGESNVQRLRQGFRRLDLDGDGLITKTEVINLAERVYEESFSR